MNLSALGSPSPRPTSARDDLAPCPFCGGAAEWNTGQTGDGQPWRYIACADCEAMGPYVKDYASHNIALDEAVIEAWNSRAPVPTFSITDEAVERAWEPDPKERVSRDRDIILEAYNTYCEWMLDDDYSAVDILHKIMDRLKERAALSAASPTSNTGEKDG